MSLAELNRRQFILKSLTAMGGLGLKSVLLNLPPAFLLRGAMASTSAKKLIFSHNRSGDPLNGNTPGSYPNVPLNVVRHPVSGTHASSFVKTAIQLGPQSYDGAQVWGTLSSDIRDQMHFFRAPTLENNHTKGVYVMSVRNALKNKEGRSYEIFPSVVSYENAAALGIENPKPMGFGGVLEYENVEEAPIKPKALKELFQSYTNATESVMKQARDTAIDALYSALKSKGTLAQRKYLDNHAISRNQAAIYATQLSSYLTSVTNNSTINIIRAAVALLKINATAAVRLSFAFGGDNHSDADLEFEAEQTVNGVADIQDLWDEVKSLGLENDTIFMINNVFGRTLEPRGPGRGRDHNTWDNVAIVLGPGVKPGVTGGLDPNPEFPYQRAAAFNSVNGTLTNPDVPPSLAHASLVKSVLKICGVPEARIEKRIKSGIYVPNLIA